MKEGRRAGGITAGPESKVLDGTTWDEARTMAEAPRYGHDAVDYKVGAASKGIIQRDYQHHATVYKSAYSRNPFDNVSADELAEYRRIIDAKSRQGDGKYYDFFKKGGFFPGLWGYLGSLTKRLKIFLCLSNKKVIRGGP